MELLDERFKTLGRRLFDEEFLTQQRTIIPNYLFAYHPSEEAFVGKAVKELLIRATNEKKSIIEVNLFDVFCEVFAEDMEDILGLEETEGFSEVIEAVEPTLNDGESLIVAFNTLAGNAEVVLLTGVGTAYPFIHASGLLKRLAVSGNSRPVIVFYPGTFNGTQLSLFGHYEAVEDEYQIYVIA